MKGEEEQKEGEEGEWGKVGRGEGGGEEEADINTLKNEVQSKSTLPTSGLALISPASSREQQSHSPESFPKQSRCTFRNENANKTKTKTKTKNKKQILDQKGSLEKEATETAQL